MEDVPAVAAQGLKDWFAGGGSKRKKEEILAEIERIGGAGELAKGAALGAMDGSQQFITQLGKTSPAYSSLSLLPARGFLTDSSIRGAVAQRDEYMQAAIMMVLNELKAGVSLDEAQDSLARGAWKAIGESRDVHELTAETAPTLATMNIEYAQERVKELL